MLKVCTPMPKDCVALRCVACFYAVRRTHAFNLRIYYFGSWHRHTWFMIRIQYAYLSYFCGFTHGIPKNESRGNCILFLGWGWLKCGQFKFKSCFALISGSLSLVWAKCNIHCRCHIKRRWNVQKWSEHAVCLQFWLGNVLRATTAYTFNISASKSVPTSDCSAHSDFKICSSHQHCFWHFRHPKMFPKSRVLDILDFKKCFVHFLEQVHRPTVFRG